MKPRIVLALSTLVLLASLLAFAQAPARHALKESSLIVPGRSVGGLDLGDDRARTLQLFPKKPNMDEEYKYPFCGGYSEIHWLDFEKKIDGVFVYLKAERVIQIESATPRFRTREGITIYSSPELLRKHFPEMRAFVLLNSGGTVNGGKDLIYWVDQKRGIAFELYYDRRVRNRRVWKTIVFNPGTEFQPEGCVVEPQTWHELEPYALDPLRNLNKESSRNVDQSRLWSTLEKLSEFGRPVGADFDAGVTRVGFSDAELAAREYVMGLMRDAGLAVRVDPAGNIFGRRAGAENLPTLLFGSHIDSVPRGGNFDGDVGSLGALEVIRALNDHKITTRHPLEMVIWTNEEGHHFGRGLLGSSAAAGLLPANVLERKDEEGKTLADWLRRYGQDPARLADARIPAGSLAAYLELHIEQGGVLDESKIQIGVVQGIVGIHWWTCTATGFANHAGTTPMSRRQDALAAAARAALAVREEVRAEAGRQVGTVGYVRVEPGARNIIPGRVEFPVELRDLDKEKVLRIWARIEKRFAEIAKEENVKLDCVPLQADEPALTDAAIQNDIRTAARAAGYSTLDLPSGAGHDAQQIARLAPIGMIFVPSRGGISHSPREYTSPDDTANGAEVLYRTILLLDSRLHPKR